MSFKWKEEYSCNFNEINIQHKKLLDLGEQLVELAMGNQDADYYDNIIEVLEELKAYTVYHFGYEEQLMDKHGYSNAEAHKFEHMFFIKKVERVGRQDIDGQQRDIIMNLLSFVADWVTSHILQQDKELGTYLSSIGIA